MKTKMLDASRTGQPGIGFQPENLLTQDDVAARLKVTVRTVSRLQNEGVIPFILLGKTVRFYWPSVVTHLNSHFTICRALRRATTQKRLKAEG